MTQTATKTRFSVTELNEAFKRVQDPRDWRNPINTIVRVDSRPELDEIIEAIEFFTATEATVKQIGRTSFGRTFRITSVGYRLGPAGP